VHGLPGIAPDLTDLGDRDVKRAGRQQMRMQTTYMPNKTISVPDDVVPIIDSLDVPFSKWVADQLRHHAASQTGLDLGQ